MLKTDEEILEMEKELDSISNRYVKGSAEEIAYASNGHVLALVSDYTRAKFLYNTLKKANLKSITLQREGEMDTFYDAQDLSQSLVREGVLQESLDEEDPEPKRFPSVEKILDKVY